MEVRAGWNSEYARKKYDVTLDEADLGRILLGEGIPLEAQASVSLDDVHTVLYCSAEILSRRTLVEFILDGQKTEDLEEETARHVRKLAREARALKDRRTAALTGIRGTWEARQELGESRD